MPLWACSSELEAPPGGRARRTSGSRTATPPTTGGPGIGPTEEVHPGEARARGHDPSPAPGRALASGPMRTPRRRGPEARNRPTELPALPAAGGLCHCPRPAVYARCGTVRRSGRVAAPARPRRAEARAQKRRRPRCQLGTRSSAARQRKRADCSCCRSTDSRTCVSRERVPGRAQRQQPRPEAHGPRRRGQPTGGSMRSRCSALPSGGDPRVQVAGPIADHSAPYAYPWRSIAATTHRAQSRVRNAEAPRYFARPEQQWCGRVHATTMDHSRTPENAQNRAAIILVSVSIRMCRFGGGQDAPNRERTRGEGRASLVR